MDDRRAGFFRVLAIALSVVSAAVLALAMVNKLDAVIFVGLAIWFASALCWAQALIGPDGYSGDEARKPPFPHIYSWSLRAAAWKAIRISASLVTLLTVALLIASRWAPPPL